MSGYLDHQKVSGVALARGDFASITGLHVRDWMYLLVTTVSNLCFCVRILDTDGGHQYLQD